MSVVSLSSTTVLLALRADNGAAAFTSFLYPVGFINLQHTLTSSRQLDCKKSECSLC